MTPQQWNTLNRWLMILGVLGAIGEPLYAYLTSGKAVTLEGAVLALGLGIAAYAKRAPGHLTPDQADEHAKAAVQASGMPGRIESLSQLPPAVPGDDD